MLEEIHPKITRKWGHQFSPIFATLYRTDPYSKKWAKEQVCLYSWDHMINHNENEVEIES